MTTETMLAEEVVKGSPSGPVPVETTSSVDSEVKTSLPLGTMEEGMSLTDGTRLVKGRPSEPVPVVLTITVDCDATADEGADAVEDWGGLWGDDEGTKLLTNTEVKGVPLESVPVPADF